MMIPALRRSGLHPLRMLGRMSLLTYRVLIALVLIAGFGTAALVLSMRYYVLPNIDQHRDRIAALITRASGQTVTIGHVAAHWNGLRPHLAISGVVVHDDAGRPALVLDRVETTLSWRSMAIGQANTRLIEIAGPNLTIRRDAEGRLSVGGLSIGGGEQSGGFGRWLLAQREIIIRNAGVVWIDESRGAPELWLRQVNLRLQSSGLQHRIGIRAVPPDDLAAPLDIRAEWRGSDFSRFDQWDGRVFAELRDTSMSGWEAWIDLPGGIERGSGAVRVWADLHDGALTSLVSDVELTDVRAQLGRELSPLEFDAMRGRVSWRQLDDGFELSVTRLLLDPPGRAATVPTVARLRWRDPSHSTAAGSLTLPGVRTRARGELSADALSLDPWVALAGQLPLDPAVRRLVADLAPRGELADLVVSWSGPFEALETWSVKARFDELTVRAVGDWPGISGLSGSVDGSERGGSLAIDARDVGIVLPAVFTLPLAFDTVTAQATWSARGAKQAFRVSRLSLANADLAGTLSGEYRPGAAAESPAGKAVADTAGKADVKGGARGDGSAARSASVPGFVDLTAMLSRAEAKAVAAYFPRQVSEDTRHWLASALVAGRATEASLRLRGKLADFPFVERARDRGQFLVTVKVEDVVLDYAPGWPRFTGIDGDLVFRGNRVEILPRIASIAGVTLQKVRAVIPDISHSDELLEVSGEAESASADFLRFIAKSPVDRLLDGATRDMEAQGRGRLTLRLLLPLRRTHESTVVGSYQFVDNRLVIDREAPVLDAVNGRLDFTESGIRVNAASARLFGAPATLNVVSQQDGAVRIGVAGQIGAEALRSVLPETLAQSLRGTTDWRATLNYRRKLGDLLVDSSLIGLAIDLPPPFGKAAADSLPLRFEQVTGAQRDRLSLSLGKLVSVIALRRLGESGPVLERATVALGGGSAPVPERRGVSVTGTLPQLDLDLWWPLISSFKAAAGAAGAASSKAALELGEIDLRVGRVDVFGRQFNEVALRGTAQPGGWQGSIASTEISGDLAWQSRDSGRLIARLQQFELPPSPRTGDAAADAAKAAKAVKFDDSELPALDVTVERFRLGEKALGRLELLALPEGRDWRIQRLQVSNPDATFRMEGLWQSWRVRPRTEVSVRLDVVDSGRLLKRLGYPEGVRGGAARIEGPLSWAGSPQDLDLATLSGKLLVEVEKGQFLTLEPGVGRLLGVFNLQNLPRRIALDFRDVFSEGFSFDEISGSVRISNGLGRLDDFRIQGPSARVLMSGEVNLPKETQKLQVRVTPAIGDSLALAGALIGGPIAGIATFIVQRILKDPLAQLATFDYAITGTWTEPTVSRAPRSESDRSKAFPG